MSLAFSSRNVAFFFVEKQKKAKKNKKMSKEGTKKNSEYDERTHFGGRRINNVTIAGESRCFQIKMRNSSVVS